MYGTRLQAVLHCGHLELPPCCQGTAVVHACSSGTKSQSQINVMGNQHPAVWKAAIFVHNIVIAERSFGCTHSSPVPQPDLFRHSFEQLAVHHHYNVRFRLRSNPFDCVIDSGIAD